MTLSKRANVARRGGRATDIERMRGGGIRDREFYATHIVEYFADVLRVQLTPPQQIAARKMQRAFHRGGRFALKSGRRTGKSKLLAGGALWAYDCHNARVIMTAPTARQVDAILWREVTMTRAKAQRAIPGQFGMLARTGLRDGSGREIVGFTAREAEAMQGLAADAEHPIVFVVDEGSGVDQPIFDAIEGNRAGGGVLWMGGNPTRTSGEFFDAFHAKMATTDDPESTGYDTCTLSTEEAATFGIGGLATPKYVAERAHEWGVDSALYKIHVLGEFALGEDGRIFPLVMLQEAIERWPDVIAEGPVQIGLDPAGPGTAGDDSALCVRQGKKILALHVKRSATDHALVAWVVGAAKQYAGANERITVVLDRDGPVGWKVLNTFRELIDRNKLPITLVPVRSSDRAKRRPMDYERVRDELAGNLHAWVKDGGALPDDPQLIAEMHAFEWDPQVTGKLKITRKDQIREELGRSPDRYDAVALACWDRPAWGHDDYAGADDDGDDRGTVDDVHDIPSPYGDTPSPYG
jgi:phage terminase large subunit